MHKKSCLLLSFFLMFGGMASESNKTKESKKASPTKEEISTICGNAREFKMKCVDRAIKQANLGNWMLALRDNRQQLTIIDSMCWNIAYKQMNEALVVKENEYLMMVNKEYDNIMDRPRWGEKKYKLECAETHKNFNPCVKQMITFEDEDFAACAKSLKEE